MQNYWESRYQNERDKIAFAFAMALDDRAAFVARPAAVAMIALERAVPALFTTEQASLCAAGVREHDALALLRRMEARAAAVPVPPLTPGAVELHFPTLVVRHLFRAVTAPLVAGSPRGMARAEAIEALTDAVYYVAVRTAVRESTSARFVRLPSISQAAFLRAFKLVLDAALGVSIEQINAACGVEGRPAGNAGLAFAAIAAIVGIAGGIALATGPSNTRAA